MNGKACAGTGEQGHLIIFTCARYAHGERMKKEEGRKKEERKNGKNKKNGNCR